VSRRQAEAVTQTPPEQTSSDSQAHSFSAQKYAESGSDSVQIWPSLQSVVEPQETRQTPATQDSPLAHGSSKQDCTWAQAPSRRHTSSPPQLQLSGVHSRANAPFVRERWLHSPVLQSAVVSHSTSQRSSIHKPEEQSDADAQLAPSGTEP
jgi:hypothetical protein